MTENHLGAHSFLHYLQGELSDEEMSRHEQHLAKCPGCLSRLEEVAAEDQFSAKLTDAIRSSTPATFDLECRFEMKEEVGRGGMGVVHQAWDLVLKRSLAVKVMSSKHLGSPAMRRRFLDEAYLGAQLQHPGIVPSAKRRNLLAERPSVPEWAHEVFYLTSKTFCDFSMDRVRPTF